MSMPDCSTSHGHVGVLSVVKLEPYFKILIFFINFCGTPVQNIHNSYSSRNTGRYKQQVDSPSLDILTGT